MRKGLVLEGGAMRGMFTAGVMDVMMEHGITYDAICGVSAGAAFGCNYKSGQIGRAIRYNMKYCNDKRYCSVQSLLKTGNLFGADFCYRELPEILDIFDTEAFRKNPAVFYVVCTDAETGKPIYKRCDKGTGEDLLWIRASASLPLIAKPVEIGDRVFMDGGIADSIPLRFMEGIGYEKIVVVLTRPMEYRKSETKKTEIMRLFLRKYPFLMDAIRRRPQMYNETVEYIAEKEKKGEIFVIRPEEALEIERIEKEPQKLWSVYTKGKQNAEGRIQELELFLEK